MARICLFVASSIPKEPYTKPFEEELVAFGRQVAVENDELVMGGISNGSMKVGGESYLINDGAQLTIIYPQEYAQSEEAVEHENVRHIRTRNVTERLDRMVEESDGFILFPGGIGSIHEGTLNIADNQAILYHTLTRRIIKPMVIYNFLGFYNNLVAQYGVAQDWGFIKPEHMPLIDATKNRNELLPRLKNLLNRQQ